MTINLYQTQEETKHPLLHKASHLSDFSWIIESKKYGKKFENLRVVSIHSLILESIVISLDFSWPICTFIDETFKASQLPHE